jgi:hypothetical protein
MGWHRGKSDINENYLFFYYPQFPEDIGALIERKIMTRISKNNYMWNYSLTSLGEYFKSIKTDHCKNVQGGFWHPIESMFRIKRGTLRHLVSNNGRISKREKSKDFEKIIGILNPYREQMAAEKKTLYVYDEIKNLMEETDPQTHEEREIILEKIKEILK